MNGVNSNTFKKVWIRRHFVDKNLILCIIKIDNDYYFADISREINYSNGKDYKYFGISINEFNDTKDIIIGRYNYKSITELEYDFLKKLDINS